ncbi:integrase [Erwinia mallotivora]|uniref:Integrase n=1 Tax=Erwinia mallotivora TaxID=69222 RepID=A0A014M4M9_9GAMM|nr:integrase [Erwinia mallotivora]EXU76756.1 integrase [Erwinia mallotivora]
MSNLFQFKSKSTIEADKNLADFIYRCKNELTVFGSDLNWDSIVWPNIAVFAKLGVITRRPRPEEFMEEEFLDFAKAYLRYQQGHNPTGARNELKALRAIDSALKNVTGKSDISNINITVLNKAIEMAMPNYSEGGMYQCGRELEKLAKFLTTNKLISNKLDSWKNPIRRPSDNNKTGKEAKENREKKLPNEASLNAIAEIFSNNPTYPRDIFTSSIFTILMSAPCRISEVLSLPVDCEYTEKDSKGVERYGLRFFAGKGAEGDIKWIPSVMVKNTKEAIRRIKELTEPARKFAAWVENNPNDFYFLNQSICDNKNRSLKIKEICKYLGITYKKSTLMYLRNKGFLVNNDKSCSLNKMWSVIIGNLPEDFPWLNKKTRTKYSNALFCLNESQLHKAKMTIPHSVFKPDSTYFNTDLITQIARDNIFVRNGYSTAKGSPYGLTSHQARHLLNTLAQRGGLSNLEIAKWSGRADVKQNRTYNHMSEFELVKMAELVDFSANKKSVLAETSYGNIPITTQEFNLLETGSVHVTEFGYCVHDYTMSPCDKYRDCINCSEQVCIKGDSEKLKRIKERYEKISRAYNNALSDSGEFYGEERWIEHHKKTLERLEELIGIMENPDIEDNAQIKLRGKDFSQLTRVMNKKAEQRLTNNSDNIHSDMLNELKLIMGD